MKNYNGGGRYGIRSYRRRRPTGNKTLFIILAVLLAAAVFTAGALLLFSNPSNKAAEPGQTKSQASETAGSTQAPNGETTSPSLEPSPTSLLPDDITVSPTENTDPAKQGFITKIYNGDSEIPSYARTQPINFGAPESYTSLEGVITFRGNNFRNLSSYGTANVTEQTLQKVWAAKTGSLKKATGDGAWTGSGWTGQPLIVKWPEETKKLMNINEDKKADPNFVEVIYPCLDGYIHFYDLYKGDESREPIKTGVPHKGTACIYPNGIPLLFIGQGDKTPSTAQGKEMKFRVYSLITGELLYSYGNSDPNKYRKWEAYDSSPLISAETDTLIQPGESGILYTIKLNTQFDKATGALSINPETPVKFTYTSPKYSENKRWWGFEDSASIWRNYILLGDNGGAMMCIDLNTMKLIWAADVKDDTNASPVIEESPEDETAYIYTANSIEKKNNPDLTCVIQKIDIKTGESKWQAPYTCNTTTATEGGVEGTPILGKGDISDLIIYPLGRIPGKNSGSLVALNKKTGAEVWKKETGNYLWSSPVTFYTPEGKSYIVVCDVGSGESARGNIYLYEGKSGVLLHKYTYKDYNPEEYKEQTDAETGKKTNNSAVIEATPAVYNDMMVIGTRGQRIFAFKIK